MKGAGNYCLQKMLLPLAFLLRPAILPGQSLSLPVQYVDPFIGTENGGNVFLGAAVPFGRVKLGPDCGNNDNNSGYRYEGNINGFSHTHVSGAAHRRDRAHTVGLFPRSRRQPDRSF